MAKSSATKYHFWALFAVVVWGTTFASTKVLLIHGLSPADIFLLRFLIAYLLMWTLPGRRLWADSLADEALLMVAGLTGGSLYFLAENTALQYTQTTNVAIIVSLTPLLAALFSMSILKKKERITPMMMVGSSISLLGVVLVVLNDHFVLQVSPIGDLLSLVAAATWALYGIFLVKLKKYKVAFITRKIFFYGILSILPFCIITGTSITSITTILSPLVILNVLFLGVVASFICYLIWNKVVVNIGSVKSANYIYLIPFIVYLVSALFLDEIFTTTGIFGGVLILGGVWLSEKK